MHARNRLRGDIERELQAWRRHPEVERFERGFREAFRDFDRMNVSQFINSIVRIFKSPERPADPQEQFRELLSRLHSELRDAKIQAADLIREQKRLEREQEEYSLSVQRAETGAMGALRSGNEIAARRHLEQKLHSATLMRQIEEQATSVRTQVQGLVEAIETYKLEIERVEREQRTWEARQRTARLKSTLQKDVSSTALSEAQSLLRASRDAALREEARAQVREEVSRSDPMTAVQRNRQNIELEKELERLRGKL